MFTSQSITRFLQKGVMSLIGLFLIAGLAFSQNLIIGAGATFTNTGTIEVSGDIDNNARTTPVTINGIVALYGTGPQAIGVATKPNVNFETLRATAISTKTFNVNSTVSTAIDLTSAGATQFALSANKLTLGGTIGNTGGATSPYDFTNTTSEVDYARTSATQTLFATTYGKLTLSGAAAFNLGGNVTAGAVVSHTGGNLTVDNNFTANAGYTFATIANVAAARALTLGTTGGSIATLTDIAATGSLVNGSGALTVTNLSDNHGTITAAANGGAITFTNAANNTGAITGGTGQVQFSDALTTATGTISAGAGGLRFNGLTTVSSGIIALGTSTANDFNGNLNNSGIVSLGAAGAATFAGDFVSVGTLNLNATSLWTYDGAGQAIAGGGGATYGHLDMAGSGTKTASFGNVTAVGNFDNGGTGNATVTTDMLTNTLAITGTRENTSSTMKFGGTGNGLLFEQGTVDYNGGTEITQIVAGDAALKYATLLFTVGGTKQIAAATIVATSGSLTVNSGVTADVSVSDSQLLVDGNLTNNGTLSNAGTVKVGP